MKITWTVGAADPVTLGEDAVKHTIEIETMGGKSLEQVEPLAGGAAVLRIPRGNVSGDLVFKSAKTYATYKATLTQFAAEYNRLNEQGTIIITEGDVTLTLANAVLRDVARIWDSSHSGVRMGIRYTFGLTTIVAS